MDGLDSGADTPGGTSGSPEQSPGLQLRQGALAGSPQPGVVTVELLVVLGLFVVVVIGGADSGAGTLVGPVREDEDLSGQARLDDAVGAGRGEVMGTSRCRA